MAGFSLIPFLPIFKNSTTIFTDHIHFPLFSSGLSFWLSLALPKYSTLPNHFLKHLWTPGPREWDFCKAYVPGYVYRVWVPASLPTAHMWNVHCLTIGHLSFPSLSFICFYTQWLLFISLHKRTYNKLRVHLRCRNRKWWGWRKKNNFISRLNWSVPKTFLATWKF